MPLGLHPSSPQLPCGIHFVVAVGTAEHGFDKVSTAVPEGAKTDDLRPIELQDEKSGCGAGEQKARRHSGNAGLETR